MESIKNVFVIGYGPSSSHTIAPGRAAKWVKDNYPGLTKVKVTLFGSLAWTGEGHGTDKIIKKVFKGIETEVVLDRETVREHILTMDFEGIANGHGFKETIISLGGGSIANLKDIDKPKVDIYPETSITAILHDCRVNGLSIPQYVIQQEGPDIVPYMNKVLKTMEKNIERGIKNEGVLPGKLHVKRRAKGIFEASIQAENNAEYQAMAASFAVAEENASGSIVVTAPTCGSCGVIPGIVRYLTVHGVPRKKIVEGLMVAGIFGAAIKTNATVSGAVAGCQAEIGSAAAMGAAMISYCFNAHYYAIAQSAEMALEHSLGLTCDPVGGYVLIPCIERNAVYAVKAINAARLSFLSNPYDCKIHFDDIVKTMYETGLDMHQGYKETSLKGLSKLHIC